MKSPHSAFVLSIAAMLALSGCGGGGGGDPTPAPLASQLTHQCQYGAGSSATRPGLTTRAATATNFSAVLTECEFDRMYRGNSTANAYDNVMYIENPGLVKKAATYSYYSYANLSSAYNDLFSKYPANTPFASGDYMKDMRELSAFLANIGQETTGNSAPTFSGMTLSSVGALGNGYGLYAVTEGSCTTIPADPAKNVGCPSYSTKADYCGTSGDYTKVCVNGTAKEIGSDFCKLAIDFCTSTTPAYANVQGGQYFGRGAKQLSYPYNYMYYGAKIYPNDKLKIGNNPSLIDTDGVLGWETGLAYWSLPYQDADSTKPAMRDGFFSPTSTGKADFDNLVGFGKTVNLINGGVECGLSQPYMTFQTLNRINNYVELLLLTYGLTPIDRLEVTHTTSSGTQQVDVYSKAQLIHNVSSLGVTIKDQISADGTVKSSSYTVVKPTWTVVPSLDTISATSTDTSKDIPPHLAKVYSIKSSTGSLTDTYSSYAAAPPQPTWNSAFGLWYGIFYFGRYNTQPLIQEYYAPRNSKVITNSDGSTTTKYFTDITSVMLYYNTLDPRNTQGLASERLDCSGVINYDGN